MDTYQFNLMEKETEYGYMPTVKMHILEPNEEGLRPMVVICPGGGYGGVNDNWEGERIAMAYLAAGFNTAIVKYAVLPHHHPLPLQNVARAIELCREHAEEWGTDPHKIAVCGFSAGGHVAGSISVLWNDPHFFTPEDIESRRYRPDASVLCYAVISSGELGHKTCFKNLIGDPDETNPLWEQLSLEKHIDEQTPPAFLFHTIEDKSVHVENSFYYAMELQAHGVPYEIHVFPRGPHALSLVTDRLLRAKPALKRDYPWHKMSVDFLYEQFGML